MTSPPHKSPASPLADGASRQPAASQEPTCAWIPPREKATADGRPVATSSAATDTSGGFSGANDDFFLGPGLETDPLVGASLGGVHIERLVGSGGMGSVYAGRQLKTGKLVAVKVVRPELSSRRALERFEFEAHVLGKLDHPGLVRILHADTHTAAGITRPFIVMEFVAGGRRLDEPAAEQPQDERSWMEIFREVCGAVAAAHARGIVHRDLKPGNILIDASRQPRVIDFGVALVRDPDLAADQPTEDGSIGTPRYMSPEQALGLTDDVDVTTDVYALGVVMYERLAGAMPYEITATTNAARVIAEVAPMPLAAANPRLSRDVCTIVMKCLEKDRASRYSSAAELAADIRRYLADEPIVASPPTLVDSVRRFCRRHRLLAASAAAIVATLLVSLGVVSFFYLEAERRRAEATALLHRVRDEMEISGQVQEMFVTTLGKRPARTVEHAGFHRELLLGAARTADELYPATATPRQRVIKAGFLTDIGRSLLAIGDPVAARDQLQVAVRTLEDAGPTEDVRRLVCLHNFAHAAIECGEIEQALTAATRATEIATRLHGPHNLVTLQLRTLEAMARMVRGEFDEAAHIAAMIDTGLAAQLPQYHPDVAAAASNHGEVLQRKGDLAAAERQHRRAIEIWRQIRQDEPDWDDPREGTSLNNWGEVLRQTGRLAEAEKAHHQALMIHRATLPRGHFLISTSLSKLAETYRVTSRLAEAEELLNEAVAIRRAAGLQNHPEAALLYWRMGLIYAETGRLSEAEACMRKCHDVRTARLGPDHTDTVAAERMARQLADRRKTIGKVSGTKTGESL
jgi:tetratricopeptide (TPR) repeat protein